MKRQKEFTIGRFTHIIYEKELGRWGVVSWDRECCLLIHSYVEKSSWKKFFKILKYNRECLIQTIVNMEDGTGLHLSK